MFILQLYLHKRSFHVDTLGDNTEQKVQGLSEPIRITIPHTKPMPEGYEAKCRYTEPL